VTQSPTPAPSLKRRAESDAVSSLADESNPKRKKRRPTPQWTDSSESDECPSMDEEALKEELRPVKKQLKKLKLSGGDLPRDDKVAILKDSLAAIGQRIDAVLNQKGEEGADLVRWRRHLWTFVTLFWPKKVHAAKLEEIHAKMVMKEAGGNANTSEGPPKKKPKLNGSTSSSSLKTNGKA